MSVILSSLTVGQAATTINVFIAIIEYTLPLFLVVLLIYFMPKTNSALAWNSINQTLHSSLWPMLLQTDSNRLTGSGLVVRAVSFLFIACAVLSPVSRVVLPLGLRDGPPVPSKPVSVRARYLPDTSALGLATSAGRSSFRHGYKCTPNDSECDSNNITAIIPPFLNNIFHSTPHSPFSIQYRQFFNADSRTASTGLPNSAMSFLTRNDTFVTEGLVIDMASAHPEIGFINHTVPSVSVDHGSEENLGGTWSRDILFLEPITSCIDTNITAEYVMKGGFSASDIGLMRPFWNYSITDHGGFVNLPEAPSDPFADYSGDFNLQNHAHIGAILALEELMLNLNTSRTTSYVNKTYSITDGGGHGYDLFPLLLGRVATLPLEYLPLSDPPTLPRRQAFLRIGCSGFGGQDPLDINNVHVTCGMFLGSPVRTDGGENNVNDPGSSWMQNIHICASATRASIETFTFSIPLFNESSIAKLNATRDWNRPTVLWAMEKRNATVLESIPLWGRIDDQYPDGNLSSLWTIQNDHFLLPASSGSFRPEKLPEGSPQNAHASVWTWVHGYVSISLSRRPFLPDYSGRNDFATKAKFQNIAIQYGPTTGAETVLNLMWTDMMANQVVGAATSDILDVALHLHTLDYDFRLAIPGYLLALMWLPVFLFGLFLLVVKQLEWTYFTAVFNQLSIGRVLTHSSALRVIPELASTDLPETDKPLDESATEHHDWGESMGQTQVTLMLVDSQGEQMKTPDSMETPSPLDH